MQKQALSKDLEDSTISTQRALEIALHAAVDQKSLDVRSLDLRGVSSIADSFVIVSGTSERHVKGIADKIKVELAKHGLKPTHVDGYENAEWIVLDYLDMIVHVFFEPVRQAFDFDKLWDKAKPLELPNELEEAVHKLRTGTIY